MSLLLKNIIFLFNGEGTYFLGTLFILGTNTKHSIYRLQLVFIETFISHSITSKGFTTVKTILNSLSARRDQQVGMNWLIILTKKI